MEIDATEDLDKMQQSMETAVGAAGGVGDEDGSGIQSNLSRELMRQCHFRN
jgi:hypothetical protein